MTSKNRRQRGSRTHGGGAHKNRRGAGNRGGRGDAGRDKHEQQNYPPLGKHGFTPPNRVTYEEASLGAIYERAFYAELHEGDGVELPDEGTVRVDARVIANDAEEDDELELTKVLANGEPIQLERQLIVIADEFTEPAQEAIETNGDELIRLAADGAAISPSGAGPGGKQNTGEADGSNQREMSDPTDSDDDGGSIDVPEEPSEVVELYRQYADADEEKREEIDDALDQYFDTLVGSSREESLQTRAEAPESINEVAAELDAIEADWQNVIVEPDDEYAEELRRVQREYLLSVRESVENAAV